MNTKSTAIPSAVSAWVSQWIATQKAASPDSVMITHLKGDGSMREFFRLSFTGESRILLFDSEWVFTKDYAAHQSYLKKKGMAVPEFEVIDPKAGVLIMEDLGDELLQTHIEKHPKEKLNCLLLATQMLARLHGKTFPVSPTIPAATRHFDTEKYREELLFTVQHLQQRFLGENPLTGKQQQALIAFCQRIAALHPQVFCHRDYHSRNILYKDGKLYMIDFQDARLGSPHYDLCSLIYDAYLEISEGERNLLIEAYKKEMANFSLLNQINWSNFQNDLQHVALQRTLKAAGSFASFYTRFEKTSHLPYLQPCLDNILTLQKATGELTEVFHLEKWATKIQKLRSQNWQKKKSPKQ